MYSVWNYFCRLLSELFILVLFWVVCLQLAFQILPLIPVRKGPRELDFSADYLRYGRVTLPLLIFITIIIIIIIVIFVIIVIILCIDSLCNTQIIITMSMLPTLWQAGHKIFAITK